MSTALRALKLNLSLIMLGAVIAFLWIYFSGGLELFSSPPRMQVVFILPLLLITAGFHFVRFIRWHFLLRRVGVRLPTRPSLGIFLATLAGTATIAYIGELLRGIFIRKRFGVAFRITTWVLIVERLLDVMALSIIGTLTTPTWTRLGEMLLFLGAAYLVFLWGGPAAHKLGVPRPVIRGVQQPRTHFIALMLSLAAWLPASLLILVAAASLSMWIHPIHGIHIFSSSTLFGALTLAPSGFGATGSITILQLESLRLALADSVKIVLITRLASTGISLTIGGIFLIREWLLLRKRSSVPPAIHFEEIAFEYRRQWSKHIWKHLLGRKVGMLTSHIPEPSEQIIGLDLGCGLGQQCYEMKKRGYKVIGIDLAYHLIKSACQDGITVTNGSALALPFANESMNFVYTIGVLHHLPGPEMQVEACREVQRVLKPGGVFLIHETNPRNPLFRFYMDYLFPVLRSIDEGIEWWIDPSTWKNIPGMEFNDIIYFTFLPDFIPKILMRPFIFLEHWLEMSRFRSYSVHYMAVIQKDKPNFQEVVQKIAPSYPFIQKIQDNLKVKAFCLSKTGQTSISRPNSGS